MHSILHVGYIKQPNRSFLHASVVYVIITDCGHKCTLIIPLLFEIT